MAKHTMASTIEELLALTQDQDADPPNSPAQAKDIRRLSDALGCELPDDYQAFLSAANGWSTILDTVGVLSIEEILDGDYEEFAEEHEDQLEDLGCESCTLIAYRTDEDTGIALLVRDGQAVIMESHQGVFDAPTSFEALLRSYLLDEG